MTAEVIPLRAGDGPRSAASWVEWAVQDRRDPSVILRRNSEDDARKTADFQEMMAEDDDGNRPGNWEAVSRTVSEWVSS